MARDKVWRQKELSRKDVIQKYPDVPSIVILKIDMLRRGLSYTQKAKDKLDPQIHLINHGTHFYGSDEYIPQGLTFRDGSYVLPIFNFDEKEPQRDPYVIDVVNDRIYVTDQGEVLEEVFYWDKPSYYDKLASNGVPMSNYAGARPQRLDIALRPECHYWDIPGEGCKYCTLHANFKKSGKADGKPDFQIINEVVKEALKDKGRFASIMLGQATLLDGEEVFDVEVDENIELLQLLGENFNTKRFPSTLVANAYNDKQLERLYEKTGLMTYTADIEILDKEKFNWICPGKARFVGYDEWKRRLYTAVDIFGKGNITSSVVVGAEQATPNGFTSEDEAFKRITEEAEDIISHGIAIAGNVWRASPGAIFQNQDTPSLDYFVRTLREFDVLHHKYDVRRYADDYRRCGSHPGLDLSRI